MWLLPCGVEPAAPASRSRTPYPVTEIRTNAERALATNARRGHIWEEFSSESYKAAPPVHVDGIKATGGAGYYRTPSLVNVWATAPFLHNNALGIFNGDPSVAGRLAAYESAMTMLLWPERRTGLIRRTTVSSRFDFEDGGSVCVARNTPVDLIANVNVNVKPGSHSGKNKVLDSAVCGIMRTGALNGLIRRMDTTPDFVQDRGHTFGAGLANADKRALIEYMKTF